MLIDSTRLMETAFHDSRYAFENTQFILDRLMTILDIVKKTDDFIVKISDPSLDSIAQEEDDFLSPYFLPPRISELSEPHQKLFHLIEMGTHELKHLWISDRIMAVRSLGYALHNLPFLLRSTLEFSLNDYKFSFRVAAAYWSDFSIDMRKALVQILDIDLSQAEDLISREGFAIQMWQS